MNTSAESLVQAVEKSREIADRLLCHCRNIRSDRRHDMQEFYLSARGVELLQAFCLVIKRFEYGQGGEVVYPPLQLAEKLEGWFVDYRAVWRACSQESELFRVQEFIRDLCRILRSYPKT